MNTPKDAIVVGVGTDGVDAALEFAVAEARRTRSQLHLVHVLQLPPGEAYAGVYGGALETAKATLTDALDRAAKLADGAVAVTGELVDSGWVVDDLARRTADVRLLVLQHRALGRVHRLFTGSVVASVAGRAHVPVVSVPEGWSPADRPPVVTAAVQDPVEAPALLRAAFEEARIRSASLVILHAWWLASGYDVAVVDPAFRDEWAGRSREQIEPVLEPLRREYPYLEVRVDVRHAPPVEAVLDAAASSELLVIGRRHHLLPLGSHLGPVARAALAHSPCPVLVIPEQGVTDEPGTSDQSAHQPSERLGGADS